MIGRFFAIFEVTVTKPPTVSRSDGARLAGSFSPFSPLFALGASSIQDGLSIHRTNIAHSVS